MGIQRDGKSAGTYVLIAMLLTGLASFALWLGLIGYPMPGRRGASRYEDLWSAYPGTPLTLDAPIFYAVAVSFFMLAAFVAVMAVTGSGPRVVMPWWVGGVQVITWALVALFCAGAVDSRCGLCQLHSGFHKRGPVHWRALTGAYRLGRTGCDACLARAHHPE
jgi:hypothetical protein